MTMSAVEPAPGNLRAIPIDPIPKSGIPLLSRGAHDPWANILSPHIRQIASLSIAAAGTVIQLGRPLSHGTEGFVYVRSLALCLPYFGRANSRDFRPTRGQTTRSAGKSRGIQGFNPGTGADSGRNPVYRVRAEENRVTQQDGNQSLPGG